MFARVTTIQADPGRIEEKLDLVRDLARDAVSDAEEAHGVALLVDRSSGRCVGATFWATEDARRASADDVADLRSRAATAVHGDITVEEWESCTVREVRPPEPGCCLRLTRLRMDPADVDMGTETLTTTVVPSMEVLEGYRGISLWKNVRTGRSVLAVLYDSAEALEGTRGPAGQIRGAAAAKAHATIEAIDEFELVWTSWGPGFAAQGGTQVPVQRAAAAPSVRP